MRAWVRIPQDASIPAKTAEFACLCLFSGWRGGQKWRRDRLWKWKWFRQWRLWQGSALFGTHTSCLKESFFVICASPDLYFVMINITLITLKIKCWLELWHICDYICAYVMVFCFFLLEWRHRNWSEEVASQKRSRTSFWGVEDLWKVLLGAFWRLPGVNTQDFTWWYALSWRFKRFKIPLLESGWHPWSNASSSSGKQDRKINITSEYAN